MHIGHANGIVISLVIGVVRRNHFIYISWANQLLRTNDNGHADHRKLAFWHETMGHLARHKWTLHTGTCWRIMSGDGAGDNEHCMQFIVAPIATVRLSNRLLICLNLIRLEHLEPKHFFRWLKGWISFLDSVRVWIVVWKYSFKSLSVSKLIMFSFCRRWKVEWFHGKGHFITGE